MNICFTGHRPKDLCGYNREKYAGFVSNLSNYLKTFVETRNDSEFTFISGGAQGFDQLAFWAVNILKGKTEKTIHNHVYIPFKGFESRWADTGLFSKHQFAQMLAHSDSIRFISDNEDKEEQGMFFRQYMDSRNHAMVKDCDCVIALFENEKWRSSKGGTAECMRWAHKHNKPIYQIYYTKDEQGNLMMTHVDFIDVFDPTK